MARTRRPPASAITPVRRGRILVLDDEPHIVTLLERVLAPHHDITITTSGPAALRAIESAAFDAIVCDVMMQEMTGAEFYRALREKDSVLSDRIVFMTGRALVPRVAEFLSTVANPMFEKPLDVAKLAQMLGDLTRREPRADPIRNDGGRSV